MNLFNTKLKKFKNISGIYKITCTANNKIYIGSARDISNRIARHRTDLKNSKHHNILLQRAYHKYGSEKFIFEVLEVLQNLEELINREQHYLDNLKAYDTRFGFNLAKEAGSCLGVRVSEETKQKISKALLGKKHSEETKCKISESHLGKTISEEHLDKMQQGRIEYIKENGHPMLGQGKSQETVTKWRESFKDYKPTVETKAKMSVKQKGVNNPSAKLTDEIVIEILDLNKLNIHKVQELADMFLVSKGTVENILYGRTWKHIPR